ncbi:MAG: hypothetical protein AAFR11_11235 [Pseudomonadota bacterium]
MKRFTIVLGLLALAGCATPPPEDARIALTAANTKSYNSEFDANRRYEGPRLEIMGAPGSWALMRSWTDKKGRPAVHQVYVHVAYSGIARDYGSASYEGGEPADFAVIDAGDDCGLRASAQEVCPRFEAVRVNIDPKEFDRIAGKDARLRFRLNAKRGDGLVVDVPPYYLKGYFRALDAQ